MVVLVDLVSLLSGIKYKEVIMAHYAKVVNGIVEKVIVAEASFFNSFVDDHQVSGFKLLIILEVVNIIILIQEMKIQEHHFVKILQALV